MYKNNFRFLLIFSFLVRFSINSSELEYLKYFSGQYDTNSDFYSLYNFVKNFFDKHDISYPINLEFSVKISDKGLDNQRYVISIPKTYLNDLPEEKYDEITSIIPNKYLKNKIKGLVSKYDVGSLIYAIDFFKGQKKYKVYFDFPVITKQGILSFDWLGKPDFVERNYKPIDLATFNTNLSQILTTSQKRIFVTSLEKYLDLNKILLKEKGDEQSVCIKFKKGILVKEVKSPLQSLVKNFKDSDKFSLFLDKINNLNISWIHLQKDEITIYTRFKNWVYFV